MRQPPPAAAESRREEKARLQGMTGHACAKGRPVWRGRSCEEAAPPPPAPFGAEEIKNSAVCAREERFVLFWVWRGRRFSLVLVLARWSRTSSGGSQPAKRKGECSQCHHLLLLRVIASLGDHFGSPRPAAVAPRESPATGAPGRRDRPAARWRPGSQPSWSSAPLSSELKAE